MFIQIIFSKPQNILLPNSVLWCIIMSWSVMQKKKKKIVCYFQGQGHSKGSYDQYMTVSTVFSELLILLLQNLVWWYIIISQSVLWKIGLLCSRSRSRQNCKMSMTVYPDAVFWFAKPYTTKLSTVVHQHEPNCLRKILVCCLQGQGQSGGSCHKRWLYSISSELLILSQLK